MDAMVTARMPQGKKEVGNHILHELGTSPSQLINEVYDYVIKHKQLPLHEEACSLSSRSIQEALAFVDSIPLLASTRFSTMTDDEIKQERLTAKGLVPEGHFE
ncbi:MAG: RelB/DinJ family addiction module antitoxin [Coriobacteriia bacterium]|jgi:antitoxin component of RelBE/YafQ-DinJ toxin-antitoxin module|nr:RelB/DinJ family addiction module antitoxin [Coriobacteriia bacterium]